MADKSKIEWTDTTWNPVTGCTKISAGCKNCYAEDWAKRNFGRFKGKRSFGDIQYHPEIFNKPFEWKRPRKIFVNSMSDLFHESLPDDVIGDIFRVMRTARQHTYQILTKRTERMMNFINRFNGSEGLMNYKNIWIGISAENQETFNLRIEHLNNTQAAVRFLSLEPLLDLIEIDRQQITRLSTGRNLLPYNTVHWIIVGGESGNKARPMHPDWVNEIRKTCEIFEIPFFFKQWGSWQPINHRFPCDIRFKSVYTFNTDFQQMLKVGKKQAGNLLNMKKYQEFPKEAQ